ncbi:MAG: aminopeptidase N [Gammaproteobacteria bacterium]|nr:aminopeptidase N [Gammaproteobacteria bacterium]
MRKDADPKAIFLENYQPPTYQTLEIRLSFDIHDGSTVVRSVLTLARDSLAPVDAPLVLDGEDLELVSVHLDGEALSGNEYQVDDASLTIFSLPQACEVSLVTRIKPEENTALEGLYKSRTMYCTQCEAQGFRKITYHQDRPDVLTRYTTSITADADRYPILLSNGNLVADNTEDGRRTVTWEDPFPKPSYLFALVAGDLGVITDTFTTMSGRSVELKIYSEQHNISQCGYAMDVLKRSMAWDEQVFGREYDLDIFMIVAVEDFNMGAMENKGLNIFNTSCVLASPDTATDLAYLRVEGVVAHEYFHNWSGNRVTCRDWFQLSLKEGFTVFRDSEFSSDMNSRTVKRIEDVSFLRAVQFAEDSGPMAHPVRPASYIEISNFYTTTVYEKGAEVVRMIQTLLGPERFRAGSDLYFERHDGSAATTDDFLAAMQAVSEVDLEQFQRWYEQAGTPLLVVSSHWDAGTLTLEIAQSCPATPGQREKLPFHVPIVLGLLDHEGTALKCADLDYSCGDLVELRETDNSLLLHLKSQQAQLVIRGLDSEPQVSFLRDFSAPVRVEFPRSSEQLSELAVNDPNGFARWDVMQTVLVAEIDRLILEPGEPSQFILDLVSTLLEKAIACSAGAEELFMFAVMLTLPDENYLFQQQAAIDVDGICHARDSLRHSLAVVLKIKWQALYDVNEVNDDYRPDALSMARRELRNIAFAYLVEAATSDEAQVFIENHYQQADNLTDRRAALSAVVNCDGLSSEFREQILDDFLKRWQNESLVVNVWFSVQATGRHTNAETICRLEDHAAFDKRNPNKLRAVYAAFGQMNQRNFHANDGSGYDLLAERIIDLDRFNPQIAARLLQPLTRWQRYDTHRRQLMRQALELIAGQGNLSKDVFEVVAKSLEVDG